MSVTAGLRSSHADSFDPDLVGGGLLVGVNWR